jgi:hypothetical protein
MLYQSDSFSSTKQHRKGEDDMTKAKARQRAKAKAAQKARKPDPDADRPGPKIRPGQFDPGAGSIKGPSANASAKNFGGARRGAARSR